MEKLEYKIITEMIVKGSSVLDLGCGDGELLSILKRDKGILKVQGIEIDEQLIYKCVKRGLSVFHGDIDSGLSEYGDNTFDYVILNQSFQQVKKPDTVLSEALRIGNKVIVSFPNFAHISARYSLALRGAAPITRSLPFEWYNTPNIHFLSIADFINYCANRKIRVEKTYYIGNSKPVMLWPNLFAHIGIFLISKKS